MFLHAELEYCLLKLVLLVLLVRGHLILEKWWTVWPEHSFNPRI